eukprot:gene9748-10745_t
MLKLVCLFAFVAYASAASFTNCNNNLPVTINLRSLPDPISIKAGARIAVKASVTVRTPVPSKIKLSLKVYKKVWLWMKLPCVKNVGSCSYDADCGMVKQVCPNCDCPMYPGTMNVDQAVTVPSSINVPSFLASGSYKVNFEARDPSNNRLLACGELKFRLSK